MRCPRAALDESGPCPCGPPCIRAPPSLVSFTDYVELTCSLFPWRTPWRTSDRARRTLAFPLVPPRTRGLLAAIQRQPANGKKPRPIISPTQTTKEPAPMASKYFFQIGDNNPLVQTLREFLYSRFYLKTPDAKVCSVVFDYSMQSMLAEYRKFHGLDRQLNVFPMGSLLDEATYEQIGSEMSDAEIAMASLHDSGIKKLLYGDPCSDWDATGPVITKDKFIGWDHPGVKHNCFDYCKEQLRVVGRSMKASWWGDKKINANIYQLYLTENVAVMKKGAQPRQFINGVKYLKSALKGKVPVAAGVEDGQGSPNADKVTDHFVVIVGRGSDDLGKYFHFYDNATGDKDEGTSAKNRLYVNCDDYLIKGTGDNSYVRATQYKSYIVTQIRETN
jgi:hypothetical protein